MQRLGLALIVGTLLFALRQKGGVQGPLDARTALWLVPYIVGIFLLSWQGSFGGTGLISFGWNMVLGVILSAACLWLAVKDSLDVEHAAEHRNHALDID